MFGVVDVAALVKKMRYASMIKLKQRETWMLIVGLMIPVSMTLVWIAASFGSSLYLASDELGIGLLVSSAGLAGVGGYAQVARAAQRVAEEKTEDGDVDDEEFGGER